MKQNIFIAALLAGMLVLAGCGGGSSSNNNGDDKMPPPPPPGGATTATAVTLPASATVAGVDLEEDGSQRVLTIKAGDPVASRTFGGVVYTCPAGECMATFENRLGNLVVTSTGGLTAAAQRTAPTGNTAPTGTSVAQSSDANIMAALEGDGQVHGFDLIITNATGGIRNTAGDTATPQTGGQRIPLAGGRYVRLRLNTATPADQDSPGAIDEILDDAAITAGEDYIFWGHWEEGVIGTATPTRSLLWGGKNPYGKKPVAGNDLVGVTNNRATYNGNARTYHKLGTATTWTSALAGVVLEANFADGTISGTITPSADGGVTNNSAYGTGVTISLGEASISDTGTFSGTKTKFAGGTNFDAGNGSWSGGFFGDTLSAAAATFGDDMAPFQAAGQFSVRRAAKAAGTGGTPTATGALQVNGAFGANLIDIPDS